MKRTQVQIYIAVGLIAAATAGQAIFFGGLQGAQPAALQAAIQHLTKVPTHFGSWHLREEQPLEESTLRMLQCNGSIGRTYVNEETGQLVEFVLLLGPSGPLVVHTPDVCMRSQHFQQLRSAQPIELKVGNEKHHFFDTSFKAQTVEGEKFNVYYAWSRDGMKWEAPESPRLSLGPLPFLYKMQIASTEAPSTSDGHPPAIQFLHDLLPILSSANETAAGKQQN